MGAGHGPATGEALSRPRPRPSRPPPPPRVRWRGLGTGGLARDQPRTLLEVFQVPELHQRVAVVVVGHVDALVLGQGVLHPGPFVPPVRVLRGGARDRGQGVLAPSCGRWGRRVVGVRGDRPPGPCCLPAGRPNPWASQQPVSPDPDVAQPRLPLPLTPAHTVLRPGADPGHRHRHAFDPGCHRFLSPTELSPRTGRPTKPWTNSMAAQVTRGEGSVGVTRDTEPHRSSPETCPQACALVTAMGRVSRPLQGLGGQGSLLRLWVPPPKVRFALTGQELSNILSGSLE